MGAYGNKQVRTPNLDKLAAAGDALRAGVLHVAGVYAVAAIVPDRAAIRARIGVTQLRTALPETEDTLAGAAQARRLRHRRHRQDALQQQPQARLRPAPRQSRSRQVAGEEGQDAAARRTSRCSRRGGRSRTTPASGSTARRCRGRLVDDDMAGTWFAQQAVRVSSASTRDEPFFLVVSFTEPHSPFHFPVEFRGRQQPEAFAVPKVGAEDGDFRSRRSSAT